MWERLPSGWGEALAALDVVQVVTLSSPEALPLPNEVGSHWPPALLDFLQMAKRLSLPRSLRRRGASKRASACHGAPDAQQEQPVKQEQEQAEQQLQGERSQGEPQHAVPGATTKHHGDNFDFWSCCTDESQAGLESAPLVASRPTGQLHQASCGGGPVLPVTACPLLAGVLGVWSRTPSGTFSTVSTL